MDDKTLADKIVELGVGNHCKANAYWVKDPTCAWDHEDGPMSEDLFVRDWRVAGALMEKCFALDIDVCPDTCDGVVEAIFTAEKNMPCKIVKIDKSLPRAINEACVEALT